MTKQYQHLRLISPLPEHDENGECRLIHLLNIHNLSNTTLYALYKTDSNEFPKH